MKIIVSTYASRSMEIVGVIGFDPLHRWRTGMRWDFGYHPIAIEQGYGIEYLQKSAVIS